MGCEFSSSGCSSPPLLAVAGEVWAAIHGPQPRRTRLSLFDDDFRALLGTRRRILDTDTRNSTTRQGWHLLAECHGCYRSSPAQRPERQVIRSRCRPIWSAPEDSSPVCRAVPEARSGCASADREGVAREAHLVSPGTGGGGDPAQEGAGAAFQQRAEQLTTSSLPARHVAWFEMLKGEMCRNE